MESKINEALKFKYGPVALMFSDEKPDGAKEFGEGKWGCVMWLLASAAKGRTAVASKKSCGCPGGGVGLGFGNLYLQFPGGIEGFYYFLSTGNECWDKGRELIEQLKPFLKGDMYDHFVHGERYMKSPEEVEKFVEQMPITEIPTKYVVLKPLAEVDPSEESPEVVVFLADQDQISALGILANYGRDGAENMIAPYAAGCQTVGIFPYREAKSDRPRAVLGLTDISARVEIRKLLGGPYLSLTVPFAMFEEMEGNVAGSFLGMGTWKKLMELRDKQGA